ncbi:MAG: acyl-[acyl-carrier-protein]--UDP-N-acetylglucosamine O-acyltransferase [Thiomonas sp. 13-66-29]|uniref:acyl-ACP--UDP-N-acetylglucosamine O-acyltransferase n=1 Tax=Thiomonas sp. TaxID=2047785 RepID=UPI000BC4B86D|nr:acyl-ACP--UDP-N-acetylglucosamine O-acyltransferase [Thiomonas sp.]OZB46149.1 MAG: acyl-[acyl-carrier-protein]--UDP-N-acetylglucosamine O-acyltransferase [Thiomonas sp. 15-66-11]OZB65458.1 MAG: acyl-[acyl-carrier-protein]--UDP-N-acetylglucosamine O-acyltransferase [Thiomonas sp. 13-66-29]
MLSLIHATALVDPKAQIAPNVSIGPYSVIGAEVCIDAGTEIGPHVCIQGRTRIGRDNRIHAFCSLGGVPQDKKYAGEPTELHIGDRNTIREYCTLNLGTVQDAGVTRLGNDNWIMAYVHLAHDCQVGNHTVFANSAQLAGHVHVGDWAILGGYTGVHQFVHIGEHVMTGISSVVTQDVPPFVLLAGSPAVPHGINAEGLRRRGFDSARIAVLREAYRKLYRQGLALQEALGALTALQREHADSHDDLARLLSFLAGSKRGIVRP